MGSIPISVTSEPVSRRAEMISSFNAGLDVLPSIPTTRDLPSLLDTPLATELTSSGDKSFPGIPRIPFVPKRRLNFGDCFEQTLYTAFVVTLFSKSKNPIRANVGFPTFITASDIGINMRSTMVRRSEEASSKPASRPEGAP